MLCQRDQHGVDGAAMADGFRGRPNADMPIFKGHRIVGPADVDMVLKDGLSIDRDLHGQPALPPQHFENGRRMEPEPLLLAYRHKVGRAEANADV